jgi:hypothetical protein
MSLKKTDRAILKTLKLNIVSKCMGRHRRDDVYSSAVLGFAKPQDEDWHQQRVEGIGA